MRLETKFNLNDHAWYMKDNVPTEVIISAIHVFIVGTNQDHIKYSGSNTRHSVSWIDHQHLFEGKLFKTKGELLASLFGGDRICKGKNCSAINGVGHSEECLQEHEAACACSEIPQFEGTNEALQKITVTPVD